MATSTPLDTSKVPSWLRYVAIGAIALGVFFRFYHLDWKIYGNDESTTSLRVAGYTVAEYGRDAFDGRIRTSGELSTYQHVTGQRSAADTIRSLAVEDPQHPPLFYLLERGWVEVFGNSVAARRALSAVIGTLVPVAAFCLCIELGSWIAGLITAVLIAVSPFHLLYSQTAREYELWALVILVSSYLLLRAIRKRGSLAWFLYGITVAFGLYSDVLFFYVVIAHGIYIAIQQGKLARETFLPFLLASVGALLLYIPWFYALFERRTLLTNNSYLHTHLPLKLFALKWIFNVGAVFFDLDYKVIASAIILVPIFALLIFSILEIVSHARRPVFLFVATLSLVPAVIFLVVDIVHGESRSTASRYLVPTWLGLELAVSFALAPFIEATAPSVRRLAAGSAIAFLVACGVASNAVSSQAAAWWGDGPASLAPIATIINAANNPLVVFADTPGVWDFSPIMLTNRLRPDVRFQLIASQERIVPGTTRGTVFFLDPSSAQRAEVARRNIVLTPVYTDRGSSNADIAKLRAEATVARAKAGIVETSSSLWTLSTSAAHT